MKTITLRNIDEDLKRVLVQKAENSSTSLNSIVLTTLREALGLQKRTRHRNVELEKLAGSWGQKDLELFSNNTSDFQKIDEELWK